MEIINVKNKKYLLEKFISMKHPKKFRYYNSRNIDSTKNHKLTILGIIDNDIASYGHIDFEKNINWFGICVLEKFQNRGYGKKILDYLIRYIKENKIENIKLSVDYDNYKAQNIYFKKKFYISDLINNKYIMKYDNYIKLPVSLGEALDKLTILDIKMKKIKDNRRNDVEKEFNLLNDKLKVYVKKNLFYYNILLEINENIWNMQDKFRALNNSAEQNKLCIDIIKENDNRFRVKKKINNINNSTIKEQKGYKSKQAFILTHLGLGDNITSIGAVRYLSTCYDKVVVVCKDKYKKNVELFYNDDKSIEIYPVNSDKDISPQLGFDYNKFKKITKDMDLYLAGSHCLTKKHEPFTDLPYNFYKDMGIDEKYCKEYFHINISDDSIKLFDNLKNVKEYIFIHNTSSIGQNFNLNDMEKKFNFDRQKILIINPNQNEYNKDDIFFELAQTFLNKPLPVYITTIINSNKIFMTDSSFYCLSVMLPIKTTECYLKSREGVKYSFDTKFTQIN